MAIWREYYEAHEHASHPDYFYRQRLEEHLGQLRMMQLVLDLPHGARITGVKLTRQGWGVEAEAGGERVKVVV